MGRYVDGFVIPVPKKNLKAYRKIASLAGKIWREYGALEYVEEVVPQQTFYDQTYRAAALLRGSADTIAAAVPIRPGKKQVSVTVKVRWSIAD